MFKIALDAGHGLYTSGKRCLKAIDPAETREWSLNRRIANFIEQQLAAAYTGYSIIRVDDITGKTDVELSTRCTKANNAGVDLYLSIHHNAGVNGGSGGGIEAYSYKEGSTAAGWRDAFYNKLVEKTGLKGNRSKPLNTANFYVLKHTKAPAVLIEHGFMDSTTDTPKILTDAFAEKCAQAIVEVIAAKGKLTKKATTTTTATTKTSMAEAKTYRVQVGAFNEKANAEKLAAELKTKGYSAIIV